VVLKAEVDVVEVVDVEVVVDNCPVSHPGVRK
jgi:hypothetical protein